jgi:hypothetical protein
MSSTTGAYAPSHERRGRTPAQWYCLIVGLLLLALGALGFLVNASFGEASFGLDFGDEDLNGDLLLGLEVNGWHNVVHLASGALLLLAAFAAPAARTVALAFGLSYALVAVIGFIDSTDVLEFVAVNLVANLFHAVLAVSAIAAGLLSRTHRETT